MKFKTQMNSASFVQNQVLADKPIIFITILTQCTQCTQSLTCEKLMRNIV